MSKSRKPLLPPHVQSEFLREILSARVLRKLTEVTPAQAKTGINVWFLAVSACGRWATGMTLQSALSTLCVSNPRWLLVYRVISTTPPQFDGLTVTRTPPADGDTDDGVEEVLVLRSQRKAF